jgi:hypothetical protein
MTIDLSTGAITSPKFRIDTSGNASFDGTISASNINGGTFSGAQINIGNGAFTVSTLGVVNASSATITGTINATSGNFSGNITSSATISGGTVSGARVSTTADTYYGSIRNGLYRRLWFW